MKKNNIKKYLFILKQIIVIAINAIILIPSLFLGLTAFFNVLGTITRTKGKIDAIIKTKPIDFYRNISGE